MMEIIMHIGEFLMRSHGIDVSKYDESFLDKSVQKRLSETHCGSMEDYCALLEHGDDERKLFADLLNINYSEFFRNPLTFAVLERIILPLVAMQNKVSRRKELRIWSAACASGQEPYSLAILLEELKALCSEISSYRIFATDRGESQINEALGGIYPAAALNNMSLKRLNRWFVKHGDTYAVKPELKENIDFSSFDLLSENLSSPPRSIFGDFDLVICANLLYYYKREYRKTILEKTGNSLASGGFLVVGEAEREILMSYGYREVFPHSAVFKK
jgi:chemotaxis methyl-accepting protein methylase